MGEITEYLHIDKPIIQAGMAGGITTPELVSEVGNNGGLGTIGAGYMDAGKLKEDIRAVKKRTNHPFAVNLFAINLEAYSSDIRVMQSFLNHFRRELHLDNGGDFIKVRDHLEEKVHLIIAERVPIVSTAFGVLSSALIDRLKLHDVTLIGMATNLEEAKLLEEAGYDIVVAQGSEAGGHRGTFDIGKYPDGCNIGLHVLVRDLVGHISLPIVAAGGIHTSEQIESLLTLGASGVQVGSQFLVAEEAGTNATYRSALLRSSAEDTTITKVFSGRPARAIQNEFVRNMEAKPLQVLPYPVQNALTKDIRQASKDYAMTDYQSLWAGQGVGGIIKQESTKEIMERLTTYVKTPTPC